MIQVYRPPRHRFSQAGQDRPFAAFAHHAAAARARATNELASFLSSSKAFTPALSGFPAGAPRQKLNLAMQFAGTSIAGYRISLGHAPCAWDVGQSRIRRLQDF